MTQPSDMASEQSEAQLRSWCAFKRCVASGQLLLVAATHPLWWTTGAFPRVPLVTLPSQWLAIDRLVVLVLIGLLFWIAFRKEASRACFAWVFAAWVALFLFNQHRLQPWAYQAAIWNLAFFALSPKASLSWLSAISISIYFYSALGKLDYQFLHTVGQDFLTPILGTASESVTRSRLMLALTFPLSELLIALGLVIPRGRRYAGFAVIGMHLTLMVLLGPLGQSHSWGVLVWNGLLALQAWYLFVSPHRVNSQSEGTKIESSLVSVRNECSSLVACIANVCFVLVLLMPLSERWGYWDHWLSWSLYSPHTSRLELEVHETRLEHLPDDLIPIVIDADGDLWYSVPLDLWSLSSLGVPIYPQGRFQLGVAFEFAKQEHLGDGVRAKLRSVANRWTGERSEQWLIGEEQLRTTADQYWLLP